METTARNYRVITQHGLSRQVRTRWFATYEAAERYAEAMSPEHNGSTCPNVDERFASDESTYQRGYFWFGNRYAVLLNRRSNYKD